MIDAEAARQRIDKWLWAARFFKTRSMAATAVDGGKVKWNGQQVKPARELKPGDEIDVVAGEVRAIIRLNRKMTSNLCIQNPLTQIN